MTAVTLTLDLADARHLAEAYQFAQFSGLDVAPRTNHALHQALQAILNALPPEFRPGPEDICLWPDGFWCYCEDLDWYTHKSDDYLLVKANTPIWDALAEKRALSVL